MKKLIALLLSVLLALTSMAPAYAAKPYLENQNFSIEASIDELADGITFAIVIFCTTHMMACSVVTGHVTAILCHSGAELFDNDFYSAFSR